MKLVSEIESLSTAVIPAFNEQGRIGVVVEALIKSEMFSQVIVVSDGSTDFTVQEAKEAGASVIELSNNQGKAEAMSCGLAKSSTPIVCFFDADLVGLTNKHIKQVLGPVVAGEVDMMVGVCDRNKWTNWLALRLPLVSGQRALHRKIFESIPVEQMSGYGAELALDRYCWTNGMKIGATVLLGLDFVRKTEKVGFLAGLFGYIKMLTQLIFWYLLVKSGKQNKFRRHNQLKIYE